MAEKLLSNAPVLTLIHGSWLGGWCWQHLLPHLDPALPVLTPTLTGLGDRAHLAHPGITPALHVQDVLAHLDMASADRVILAAHSYGAVVAHGLLDALGERLAGLIVIDGFLPEPGVSVFQQRPDVQQMLQATRLPEQPWLLAPLPAEHLGIEPPALAQATHALLRPMPAGTHEHGVQFSSERLQTLPCSFIHLRRFGLLAAEAQRAAASGWACTELDAGHFAMIDSPRMLATALNEQVHRILATH